MAERQQRLGGDCVLAGVFGIVGAVVGLMCYLPYSDGPEAAVTTVVVIPSYQVKTDASLSVIFFGRAGYTRTASDESDFAAELIFWTWAPLAFAILAGASVCGIGSHLLSRWRRRTRETDTSLTQRQTKWRTKRKS
jgi:hypothetical protein